MNGRLTLKEFNNLGCRDFVGPDLTPVEILRFQSKIEGYFKKIREDLIRNDDANAPDILWHYTSTNSLYEILKSNSIFLSDSDYLNDPKEGGVLIEDIKSIEDVKNNFEFKDMMTTYEDSRRMIQELSMMYREQLGINNCYLASFSSTSTSLDQWRVYGDDANGVCIGLDGKRITSQIYDQKKLHLHKIVYDKLDQKNIAASIYDAYVFCLNKADSCFDDKTSKAYAAARGVITNEVVSLIEDVRYTIKHDSYINENEWRLRLHSKFKFNQDDMAYIARRNSISEVFRLSGETYNGCLPIRKIVCGPLHNHKLTRMFVNSMRSQFGNIEVTKSDLPYRGK